jgi:DNA-binding NarL/FixJ family response regulator
MSIRVILVDDHPVVRAGLRSVIDAPEHIAVIGEADSGEGRWRSSTSSTPMSSSATCDWGRGSTASR